MAAKKKLKLNPEDIREGKASGKTQEQAVGYAAGKAKQKEKKKKKD